MQARFIKSAADPGGFPEDSGAEVAVVGRSNSGKSSAINAIVGHGKLARVSKTPGRTQLINFFELGAGRRLVDLPGYGFARVPARVRGQWQVLIEAYFEGRGSLKGLLLTVDIRRGLTDGDRQMIGFARSLGIPALVLLTKADKLSRGAGAAARLAVMQQLEPDIEAACFSAVAGTGLQAARTQLTDWLDAGTPGSGPSGS